MEYYVYGVPLPVRITNVPFYTIRLIKFSRVRHFTWIKSYFLPIIYHRIGISSFRLIKDREKTVNENIMHILLNIPVHRGT